MAPEITPQRGTQMVVDLAAQGHDLIDPAPAGIAGGRVLQEEQVLDDPSRPAAQPLSSLDPQIGDLLGDVREVERQIWARARKPAQLPRLGLVQA